MNGSTKGGSSPTRTRGRVSSLSGRRSASTTEDTLMDALIQNTHRRRQRMTTDDSTPFLDEASTGPLSVSLEAHLQDDTAQPSSGLNNAFSPRGMDNQAMRRALQTGRRLLPLNSVVPSQDDSRSDASREETLVEILAEAIEISALQNLGIVNSVTTDRPQRGPPERENQNDQQ